MNSFKILKKILEYFVGKNDSFHRFMEVHLLYLQKSYELLNFRCKKGRNLFFYTIEL